MVPNVYAVTTTQAHYVKLISVRYTSTYLVLLHWIGSNCGIVETNNSSNLQKIIKNLIVLEWTAEEFYIMILD